MAETDLVLGGPWGGERQLVKEFFVSNDTKPHPDLSDRGKLGLHTQLQPNRVPGLLGGGQGAMDGPWENLKDPD